MNEGNLMILYCQIDKKNGTTLLAKSAQKALDVSVIPGSHFKFCPLEKTLTFLGGTWGLIFRNDSRNSIPPSKHTS